MNEVLSAGIPLCIEYLRSTKICMFVLYEEPQNFDAISAFEVFERLYLSFVRIQWRKRTSAVYDYAAEF